MVKSKGAKRDKNRKAKSMKKKRVAQHIKEANDKRATAIQTGEGLGHRAPLLSAPLGVGRPSASNKRPREPAMRAADPGRAERDRAEATAYLTAWMAARNAKESADDEANEGGGRRWKFNKNTQAWLLRNMFSEDEVDESAFGTMCLYLDGLKGASSQRVLAQAQEIIDKHGPDDEEEEEVGNEAAQGKTPENSKRTASETVDFDTKAARNNVEAPGGYNSDNTDSEECPSVSEAEEDADVGEVEGAGRVRKGRTLGLEKREAGDKKIKVVTIADGVASGNASDFSFSFSEPGAASGAEEGVSNEGKGDGVPKGKRQRKARAAVKGVSKAELKSKLAAVAFERALRVAEVLA